MAELRAQPGAVCGSRARPGSNEISAWPATLIGIRTPSASLSCHRPCVSSAGCWDCADKACCPLIREPPLVSHWPDSTTRRPGQQHHVKLRSRRAWYPGLSFICRSLPWHAAQIQGFQGKINEQLFDFLFASVSYQIFSLAVG